ncbi:MAG: two pore domain potassium channel family protein [Nitrospinae bacterium]|nr:two pore domain potassium channel family protein [Nitrospinota bacterium]
MTALVTAVSCALLFVVLWDALRLTRLFYRYTWIPWSAVGRRIRTGKRREAYLSFYGPLSLLLLLSVWAMSLIVGFGMLQWALGSALNAPEGTATFGTDLYMSGTTFFTLGLGDVTPRTPLARALTVMEAGTGFGFLAMVIAYLPVLYQAFSRREVSISLLDARAGSPPSAAALLRRHGQGHMEELGQLLRDWERWSAELLESHLSYPVLGYYRSQHDNQSWLAALTTILDASALAIVGIDGGPARQARLTFAMARHAVVDLAQIFNTPPRAPEPDRLPPADLTSLQETLAAAGVLLCDGDTADQKLAELRRLYEPYVNALADYLCVVLPPWALAANAVDNWQTSAWERSSTGIAASPLSDAHTDEHF